MFAIKIGDDFVHGFSKTHQIVQLTNCEGLAKTWKHKVYAEKFLAKYGDAGYGISKNEKIVTI